MGFHIEKEKCVGCGACIFACLYKCVHPEDSAKNTYYIDEEHCLECAQCFDMCPNSAITPPAGWKRIKKVVIHPEKCNGCATCHFVCLARAPKGERGSVYEIQQDKCYHCGVCATHCKQQAIEVFRED